MLRIILSVLLLVACGTDETPSLDDIACSESCPKPPSVVIDHGSLPARYLIHYNDSEKIKAAVYNLTDSNYVHLNEYTAIDAFGITLDTAAAIEFANALPGIEMHPVVMMYANYEQDFPTWGLDRLDQPTLPLDKKFRYPDQSGKGINAYVIDTGIFPHKEFKARLQTGFSAVDTSPVDCNGHGTHVAGIIGATTYGVAKQANLYPVKVLNCDGEGTDETVIKGIDWVIKNHKKPAVANFSLGGEASAILDKAISKLVEQGVAVVVAAGNESEDACKSSPAREPSAITVGSTTIRDTLSSFSNVGKCIDILAPGSDILSTYLDDRAVRLSGTSMASPFTAGTVALVLGKQPTLTPKQVGVRLKSLSLKNKINGDLKDTPNRLLQIPK